MAADINHAVQQLLGVLDETWRGRPVGLPAGWTYYSFPDHGLEQALAGLGVEEAARRVGNTSIAQQVQHTAFGAGVFAAWLRGDSPEADWAGSWQTGELDAAAWEQLKEALWSALAELRHAVAAHAMESNERLTTAHGAVAHLVYHHGSIRAKATSLGSS